MDTEGAGLIGRCPGMAYAFEIFVQCLLRKLEACRHLLELRHVRVGVGGRC